MSLLSDNRLVQIGNFFQKCDQWTEVEANLVHDLGLTDTPDLAHDLNQEEFIRVLKQRLQAARGDVTVMSRPHSALYPTHRALRGEMVDPGSTKVAEIVFDKHIDTVINPGVDVITSGNVYNFLTSEGYLTAPVILGPDDELINTFTKRGEDKKIPKLAVTGIADVDREWKKRQLVTTILGGIKKWGITNVTFTVDLDVFSPTEGVFAVRYSPITSYLGLGCQILPEDLTPEHIESLNQILFPTPQVQYLLQENQVRPAQQLSYVRASKNKSADGSSRFSSATLSTDIGMGEGVKMDDVLGMIKIIKEELPKYGIQDGILLKAGGRYRGAVVEMCGYEDTMKKTSRAAIKMNKAITS